MPHVYDKSDTRQSDIISKMSGCANGSDCFHGNLQTFESCFFMHEFCACLYMNVFFSSCYSVTICKGNDDLYLKLTGIFR